MLLSIELQHYVERLGKSRTENLKRKMIARQASDMQSGGETHCGCGVPINAMNSFRCVYCGLFLCVKCAEIHFGITREAYDALP